MSYVLYIIDERKWKNEGNETKYVTMRERGREGYRGVYRGGLNRLEPPLKFWLK